MTLTSTTPLEQVRKSIVVQADINLAFEVFTSDMDSWWPRTHHIGKSPMTRALLEGRAGGRCYSEQQDGTECDWGTVTAWEPPRRLVFAWQVRPDWTFEPDLARSSEVEVRFIAEGAGVTRVELEHRFIDRHGEGAGSMRTAVDSPNGWSGMLQMYADRLARSAR